MKYISLYNNQLQLLCTKYKVKQMYAFGSVLTEKFSSNSDIDLKISMLDNLSALEYGENVLALWNELELLFNRPVDLLTEETIQNPFLKKEIEQTQILVYDRENEKVFI